MKEYKFRAWDKEYNIMSEVYTFYIDGDQVKLRRSVGGDHRTERYLQFIKNVEIMQFTGLKERRDDDKVEKEIYEGDIVRVWGGTSHYGCWEFDQIIVIKDMINDCFYMGEMEYVQVIGNKFQNPEIVEREENKELKLNKSVLW